MPPKAKAKAGLLRRPAARLRPRRRPAAREGEEAEEAEENQRKAFADLKPHDLVKLGPILLREAVYYGRKVQVAGAIADVRLQGGQLYADLKVSGTQDEELLRILSGKKSRLATLHVCERDCGQLMTEEALIHSKTFEATDLRASPWMTNLKEAGEPGEETDEMVKLREAQRGEERGDRKIEESKKKEKKRRREDKKGEEGRETKSPKGEEEVAEVGQKELKAVYENTGMDPDVKRRTRLMKKAQKLSRARRKKKKKKEDRSTSSVSGSSGSTSSTGSSPGSSGLFSEETRLKQLWKRYPGVLSAQAISEMKSSLMTGAGTMWSLDRSTLPPLCTHYGRTQLMPHLSIVVQQETLTLCTAMDQLIQGKVASGLDVLAQRLKAIEAMSRGGHWSMARQMELCRVDGTGISEEGESPAAARRAKEEERLRNLMARPSGSKGGDFSQGKTRKGKEKGTGKGGANEGNKGKGGQGGREDNKGAWQKKKD